VQLVDVGTRPRAGSVAMLIKSMVRHPHIGGVCGEIAVRDMRMYNFLEAAQHFEYKLSHVMDKSMESVFGYISVLPGAFSAYRFRAIRGTPLGAYFRVEETSLGRMGPFLANMYLAEDRVLSFETVGKKATKDQNSAWTLHYVKNAVADTDVPSTLTELVKQRRRWLNGSFFALVYYISHFGRVLQGGHSYTRRIAFIIQFLYQTLNLLMGWFLVATLFLSLEVVFASSFDALSYGDELHFCFTLSCVLPMPCQQRCVPT